MVTANNLGGESFPTDPICTNGPNCAPEVNNTSIGVVQDSTNTIDLSDSHITEDEEGNPLTFNIGNEVCCNIISINGPENEYVEFEYDETQEGCAYNRDNENIATFGFSVTDIESGETSETATVTIYVIPENHIPVAITGAESQIVPVDVYNGSTNTYIFHIPHDGGPNTNTVPVTLVSLSTDEDIEQTGYDALTYDWILISGDSANIDDFGNLIYYNIYTIRCFGKITIRIFYHKRKRKGI